jgi:hypothetical protein
MQKSTAIDALSVDLRDNFGSGLVLMVFMLIPIFPIKSTIGLFVVIFRPNWFKQLVDTVYADKSEP